MDLCSVSLPLAKTKKVSISALYDYINSSVSRGDGLNHIVRDIVQEIGILGGCKGAATWFPVQGGCYGIPNKWLLGWLHCLAFICIGKIRL